LANENVGKINKFRGGKIQKGNKRTVGENQNICSLRKEQNDSKG
jgi:hypothetical protein